MPTLCTEDLLEVARLFVKDRTGLRRNVYVYPTGDTWAIRIERDLDPHSNYETQRAALDNAEGMLKRKEASAVIVYGENRRITEIIL